MLSKASTLVLFTLALHVIFDATYGAPGTCTRCTRSQRCNPPDCFCCRDDLNMPFAYKQVPQIVFFTFDDAVTNQVAGFYKQLFGSSRKNPNGCPISMTLFVSHDNTKYDLVREFYEMGIEIASHSVTHSAMNSSNFYKEAKQQKENIAKLAKIPIEDIKGWRSPYLKPAGDLQPDTLHKLGYVYDATLTFSKRSYHQKPPGPFTLDYGWPYECQVRPCPRNRHPGFWEVPVVSLMDYKNEYDCVYVDGCLNAPPDEDAAYKFLWDNFYSYHSSSKMPFGINMHPSWFYYPERLKAMDRFIRELVKMEDVYIVSAGKMIEWLKEPTPLSELSHFRPWSCDGKLPPVKRYRPRVRPSPPPAWHPGRFLQSQNKRRMFLKNNLVATQPPPVNQRKKDVSAQERHMHLMIQNKQLQNEKVTKAVNKETQKKNVNHRRISMQEPVQTLWQLNLAPKQRVSNNKLVPYQDNKFNLNPGSKAFRRDRFNKNIWSILKPTIATAVSRTERPNIHRHFDDFLQRIQQPALTGRITVRQTQKPATFRYTVTPKSALLNHIKVKPDTRTESPRPSFRQDPRGQDTQVVAPILTTEHPLLKRRRIQIEHFRRRNETIVKQREREEKIREKQLTDIRAKQRALKLKIQERQRNRQRQLILDSHKRNETGFRSNPVVVHKASPKQRQAWQRFIQMMLRRT